MDGIDPERWTGSSVDEAAEGAGTMIGWMSMHCSQARRGTEARCVQDRSDLESVFLHE